MRLLISSVIILIGLLLSPAWAAFEAPDSQLTFSNQSNQFVPVDQAFAFNSLQQNDQLTLTWQVKPDYYLYQHQLQINGQNVELETQVPNGTPYHDEYFGDVAIYTEPLQVEVLLKNIQDNATVSVTYQGCAKAGFCYPPEKRLIEIAPISDVQATQQPRVSEQQQIADSLSDNAWSLPLFFILGIGLAFTPCLLPMYPIITSIVLGQQRLNRGKTFWLAFSYVQGMAITYSLIGLIVASAGFQFQAMLQSPTVLIVISLLFVLLSLSMFGLYTLQMPSSLQTRLNQWSAQQKGGALASAFIMGAISGLICSPCTTAPLSGALLYVAQSGDLLTGSSALYLLSLGMGVPLIAVALFGQQILPKSGAWMDKVKTLFGFVLLAAPVFLLERITPAWLSALLWSALGLTTFAWLYWQKNRLPFGGWKQTALGVIAVLGLIASIKPLLPLFADHSGTEVVTEQHLGQAEQQPANVEFIRIKTVDELQQQLAIATQNGKPVMLDFYADWCVACKEFEHKTFANSDVAHELSRFHLLQADVTKNQKEDFDLLSHLKVLGLPTLIFWDVNGQEIEAARITGFMPTEPFLQHIRQPRLQKR